MYLDFRNLGNSEGFVCLLETFLLSNSKKFKGLLRSLRNRESRQFDVFTELAFICFFFFLKKGNLLGIFLCYWTLQTFTYKTDTITPRIRTTICETRKVLRHVQNVLAQTKCKQILGRYKVCH